MTANPFWDAYRRNTEREEAAVADSPMRWSLICAYDHPPESYFRNAHLADATRMMRELGQRLHYLYAIGNAYADAARAWEARRESFRGALEDAEAAIDRETTEVPF